MIAPRKFASFPYTIFCVFWFSIRQNALTAICCGTSFRPTAQVIPFHLLSIVVRCIWYIITSKWSTIVGLNPMLQQQQYTLYITVKILDNNLSSRFLFALHSYENGSFAHRNGSAAWWASLINLCIDRVFPSIMLYKSSTRDDYIFAWRTLVCVCCVPPCTPIAPLMLLILLLLLLFWI